MPAADTEFKKIATDLATAFEEFKGRLAAEEAERAKLGTATSETAAELKRVNAAMDEMEKKMQRAKIAAGLTAIDEAGAETKAKTAAETKAFHRWVRTGAVSEEERKALATDDDTQGGYLVPHDLANRIIQKLILVSPMRELASTETTSSNALEIPAEGATNFDAGWVAQRAARNQTTTATLRLERIPAHEMYAEPAATQTQLDDSAFDVESWMSGRIATRLAQIEGQAFIAGDGNGKPQGVLAAAAAVPVLHSGNANTLTADGIIDCVHDLPTFYARQARFGLNRKTIGVIRKFKDANGQYLWQPGGFGGPGFAAGWPATIMGQPYTELPDMPDVAAGATPVIFGDFKMAYVIVDRLGVRVMRDPFTQKPFILFYTTKRVGGQIVLAEAARVLTVAA